MKLSIQSIALSGILVILPLVPTVFYPHVLILNGHAFSPDDTRVLIRVELIEVSSSSFKHLSEIEKSYQPRWYVVDTGTGEILKEYHTKYIPKEW